jgi:hypothetical protein
MNETTLTLEEAQKIFDGIDEGLEKIQILSKGNEKVSEQCLESLSRSREELSLCRELVTRIFEVLDENPKEKE